MLLAAAAQTGVGAQSHLDAARRAEVSRDYRTAETEYAEAAKVQPNWETFQRLGLVRHLQNKFDIAIPAFQQAIHLNPDAWGAQLFLGIDLYRMNRFSAALEALRRADRLRAGEAEVRFWLGATYIALKHYLEGEEILEDLVRKESRNLEALRILAQSYSDYAVELHNRITAESPHSAWAYRIHGQALETEGHCEAAVSEYRKALTLSPNMDRVAEAIARCQSR